MFDNLKASFQRFFFRVSNSEKILFAQHLALMIKAGMGEIESLRVMQGQVQNANFKKILADVIRDLENGQFLSSALARYRWIFGDFFINIIKVGEVSGTLPDNLAYLAKEMNKKRQLEAKVRSAMIYPVIILIVTVGITSAIIFFVIPKILPIFSSLNISLPASTKFLIFLVNFMTANFVFIAIGVVLFFFIMAALLRLPIVKRFFDRLLVYLPVVKEITVYYNVVNTTRTLSILLKSGIKIIEAIEIVAGLITNTEYARVLRETGKRIERGEPMYKYLSQEDKYFPSTVTRIIEIGERTGTLDANLVYLSEFYESELDETIKNLSSILEPAMLVLMGGIVGFVAISIITPIYQVTQSIKR